MVGEGTEKGTLSGPKSGQIAVGSVAEGRSPGVLAVAESDTFLLRNGNLHRLKGGSGMGAVAPRLILGTPAGAPPVSSWFEFKNGRGFRGDFRLAHGGTLANWEPQWNSSLSSSRIAAGPG